MKLKYLLFLLTGCSYPHGYSTDTDYRESNTVTVREFRRYYIKGNKAGTEFRKLDETDINNDGLMDLVVTRNSQTFYLIQSKNIPNYYKIFRKE